MPIFLRTSMASSNPHRTRAVFYQRHCTAPVPCAWEKKARKRLTASLVHRPMPQHLAPLNEQQVGAAFINKFRVMCDQEQALSHVFSDRV